MADLHPSPPQKTTRKKQSPRHSGLVSLDKFSSPSHSGELYRFEQSDLWELPSKKHQRNGSKTYRPGIDKLPPLQSPSRGSVSPSPAIAQTKNETSLDVRSLLQFGTIKKSEKQEGEMQLERVESEKLAQDKPGVHWEEGKKESFVMSVSAQKSLDEDELLIQSMGLRTGEDTIAFFARFGNQSPIKFVHLNRLDGDEFRPYDLVVVSRGSVKPEHFTMSAAGVVHICPGSPSELVPLSEWMRHSILFNVLRSIRFFKHYLIQKMFTSWRKNVRFRLYCQQRQKLALRYFVAKPSFCSPLLEVTKHMADLQQVQLMDLKNQRTYECKQFADYQSGKRAEASKQFENIMDRVQVTMEKVCTIVTNRAQNTEAVDSGLELAHASKSRSMASIREEQAERMRQLKLAIQEAEMLGDFIRLLDYMAVENLIQLTIRCGFEFLQELVKSSRKARLLETMVRFGPDSILFSPTSEEVQSMLSAVLDEMVSTARNVTRVVFTRTARAYVSINDGPKVDHLIRSSFEYQAICQGVQEKVVGDFESAAEQVTVFESGRPVYQFDLDWNFEDYKRQKHSLQTIRSMINTLESWEKEVEKMKYFLNVGIMQVESRKLRSSLLNITSRALDQMKDLLRDTARDQCREQREVFKQKLEFLENRPTQLKDFAGFVEKLNLSRSEEREFMRGFNMVDEMYRLQLKLKMRISPEDDAEMDHLRHLATQRYMTECKRAEEFVEEKMPDMSQQLYVSIAKVREQLGNIGQQLSGGVFIDSSAAPEDVMIELNQVRTRLDQLKELSRMYSGYQQLFDMEVYDQKALQQTEEQFQSIFDLWNTYNRWNQSFHNWCTKDFLQLDVEQIQVQVQEFYKDSYSMNKKLKLDVSEKLKEKVEDFRHLVPSIVELGNKDMKPRHWEKIFHKLGRAWYPGSTFSLQDLESYSIFDHRETISEISAAASGEAALEKSLETIKEGWSKMSFILVNHRDQKDLFILGGLDDIYTLLEENQVSLQAMMGSRFIMGVQGEVEAWEKKLAILSETLDEWVQCQKQWIYLENIFSAEDIQRQLPSESIKFQGVDKTWKDIMRNTHRNLLAIACVEGGSNLLEIFQQCNKALEEIQKSLEEYLETKRMAFPRFYFLSNDELIEILSQTRDPHAVQPHLGKCFDSMKKLQFDEAAPLDMMAMVSGEGEIVQFSSCVRAEGLVEYWLLQVEQMMRTTLYDLTKRAFQSYPVHNAIDRSEWFFQNPAMCTLVVDQIFWTANCSQAIHDIHSGKNPRAMQEFYDFSVQQIDSMVALVRGELSFLERTLVGTLIVIDVHARDVVRALLDRQVSSSSEFEWTKQLRYYWEDDVDNCIVRQTNTRFEYGYEYLGNGPRLVITPLTDICYMTLTGALHLRLGGAPAGPAGTGKTETTKDLAKALAVQCVVFNCSDGLNFKIMGRFFSGLAQAGAWACFDEFNRIDIEVLSVIAQQILCIQQAISSDVTEFEFEGRVIPLNNSFGVFITMNPGYAGRTELPDNLKALFRPVAMMVPDYRLIAEIILFSEGFTRALALSNKMVQLYKLSSEQLSKQHHYDFGMRAVKSVLVAAGQLKRKEPQTNEDLLLIRAMRDSNVPKFLEEDLPLFRGIIRDLFPGVEVPFVDYGELQKAIEEELRVAGLEVVPSFVSKVIQVHETQLVRHGMMVVGETGSGKTTNLRILSRSLTRLYEKQVHDRDGFFRTVHTYTLNPKAITAGQLYGEFHPVTREWSDGIVPKLVRQAVSDETDSRKWIVFDGPVDAVWIENMNTVLDDNKTLCLSNSERIKLPSSLHMLFEVQDLAVASPATVSRCGMVYMEQVHIGLDALVTCWEQSTPILQTLSSSHVRRLAALVKEHVPKGINFVRENCSEKIPSTPASMMRGCLNLLDTLIAGHNSVGVDREGEEEKKVEDVARVSPDHPDLDRLLEMYFVFAFAWSVGATSDDSSSVRFAEFAFQQLSSAGIMPSVQKSADGDSPQAHTIFDFYVSDSKEIATACSWETMLRPFLFDPNVPYFKMLVPTADTVKYRFLLETMVPNNKNVLFVGETGVGKSVVVQAFLNEMVSTEKYVSIPVNYSAQTSPDNLKDIFENKLEKKRKNLLGPPSGKCGLFFIDDLNMPALEKYGAQPPNELLRQTIDSGGFYDTQKLFFKQVQEAIFVAACAPPGGGRNPVSPRLVRHFHLVWVRSLSQNSMQRIFESILHGFLSLEIPAISSLARRLVNAAVDIYQSVEQDLLPTPTKSHYTFNLRDLSKVFQGVLMITRQHVRSEEDLVLLWLHEEARVFRDRLVSEEDRDWFNNLCKNMLQSHLNLSWPVGEFADVVFADFVDKEGHKYQRVSDLEKINDLLDEALEEYNISFSNRMDLVFFKDAVLHVSRIARVLRQPRGNALLVGVGGSGRQSLTRLASFISEYKLFSIEITRGYNVNEWHEDLKKVLMMAGAENKPVTFLFSDTQIVKESFLEDINNVLNSGEVPNLYAPEELDTIVNAVRPLAKAAGLVETREAILQYYTYLVRENLHIVLAFSPIGASFRNRCRMFPSLVNCCTIDWFSAWPEDALRSVAMRTLNSRQELGISNLVEQLAGMAMRVHKSVEQASIRYLSEQRRYNYTTPTSYLELLRLYMNMLESQRDIVQSKIARYRTGLQKLKDTEEKVASLQQDLTLMRPVLQKAQEDTATLLQQLEIDQKEADDARAIAERDQIAAATVAEEVAGIKNECQRDLDEALPAYYSAMKALETLDKKHIQEVKSFPNPPKLVSITMEAVCLLLGEKQTWDTAKKLLNDLRFLDNLKEYDKDNIDPRIIRKLQKYIDNPDFTPDKISSVSTAATSLCMWVRAMHTYDNVNKSIEPKRHRLAEAEEHLKRVEEELAEKQSQLRSIEAKLAELQKSYDESMRKREQLERDMETTSVQLVRAGKLTTGLSDEKSRWAIVLEELQQDNIDIVGNMMLAAGCIAYAGPFTAEFRRNLIEQWTLGCEQLQIPVSDHFSLQHVLADPVVVREWVILGLPADNFSIENGMIATMGRRWPLMIDPQSQANRWVKNMYRESNMQIIKLTERDFLRTLENAIRYGAPVLLENVEEELDPALEPVLLKQLFKKNGQWMIRLGDSDVPYSNDFKFYITTKLSNPHYLPEVCVKVTVINFTVTTKGLEDQLLVDVVGCERPDLEAKKDQLVVSIAADKKQLKEIEDKILYMLANSTGNILDDEELINNLAASKETSAVIAVRMAEAEKTTVEINSAREEYRPVASRGSILYFVVADLARVDPMYQYSLQYFQNLYNARIQKSTKNDDLSIRITILLRDITESIYVNICRGLFEKDKLLFAFSIATRILIHEGSVSDIEWKCFLLGISAATNFDSLSLRECPLDWMNDKVWSELHAISGLNGFSGIVDDILANHGDWKRIYVESAEPHRSTLPGQWNAKLSDFKKLLLLRAFREEKVVFGVREFVFCELGKLFMESPPFDLEGAFEDSTSTTPLIFVLSPGADVSNYLLQLAKQKGKDGIGLKMISLGQGQGPVAKKLMEGARESGDWVCLQNCHLAASWLGELEQILEQSDASKIHQEYRLWLTSMPSDKFPVSILQNGIKITTEPPRGLKANLARTFRDIGDINYENCSKPREWKKLLFGLAFYNAIALERRKFGAIGWNIPYEWMNSDLKTAIMQLKMYLEEQPEVPYETLNAVVGVITYGGRITDVWDKRTNASVLRRFICPEIMDDSYRFSESSVYYAPPESDLHTTQSLIDALPLYDSPDTFGLHSNADITLQQRETKSLLDTIITMQGGGGGGGSEAVDSDVTISDLADHIESRLPDMLNKNKAHPDTFSTISDGSINSMGVFCAQELSRFNKLLKTIRETISQLKRAIKGLIVMSPALEVMYSSFEFQRVPPAWEDAGYPCLKPLASWIVDFLQRMEFMKMWIENGPPNAYWLSGFFFPQGFLTSVLQLHSRKTSIAVDTLTLRTDILHVHTPNQLSNAPENGVYIYGLFMEGARFDIKSKKMEESFPGQLFAKMPIIWLDPVVSDQYQPSSVYECPLYKTSLRAGTLSTTGHSTNFVVALNISSDLEQDHWIRRGVAMLCMLDD